MVSKNLLMSKTFWFNFLTALVAALAMLVPGLAGVGAFLQAHVAEIGMLWGLVGVVLRMITKDKVTLLD